MSKTKSIFSKREQAHSEVGTMFFFFFFLHTLEGELFLASILGWESVCVLYLIFVFFFMPGLV